MNQSASSQPGHKDLSSLVKNLKATGQLIEISEPVDPRLELAEIHRRVIEREGPALLFSKVKGSSFPVVTNLFGTRKRVDFALGTRPLDLLQEAAKLPHELLPPTISRVWQKRKTLFSLAKAGTTTRKGNVPVLECVAKNPKLNSLPIITSWPEDGGPFVTLPLVYTEHPTLGTSNLGMYRIQRYDDNTTGMHMQIGKGGGFHLAAALEKKQKLPLNVFLGGPPAAIIAAIAPLPENVPELLLASLLIGEKLALAKNPYGPLPLLADAEFVLIGSVDPEERRLEGPFGDHYGYYSLAHDFPVFHCEQVVHRKNAIYPATVVGKPRQEDYHIRNYLQQLLSPLFPVVMPAVKDLWSYGETGFHSLAAAVVRERYKREAMSSAFRILGEGQLSLTKFLLLLDTEMDLKNFRAVLEYVLARADFRSDLYVFANLSLDTLDYTGPKLNEGSRGVLIGMGEARRELPGEFSGALPMGVKEAAVFCKGCLCISGIEYEGEKDAGGRLAKSKELSGWPLIILCDDAKQTAASEPSFLWSTFTRFEPAADIYSAGSKITRMHIEHEAPIVIDARMKPGYPGEVLCDPETSALVDERFASYFKGTSWKP